MRAWKKAVRSAAVGCAICLGAVLPTALSGVAAAATLPPQTRAQLSDLIDRGVLDRATPNRYTEGQADWFVTDSRVTPDTLMVVSPGTDDTELYPRMRGMRGDRNTVVVDYPQALGPFVSGKSGALLPFFAPSYDLSRDIALRNNLAVMRGLNTPGSPFTIYTGFSQGAEALGNAAEIAYRRGLLEPDGARVVLVADPRSPWGLKSQAGQRPWARTTMELLGAEANGARDPGNTGNLDVTSVIIMGDPAADLQWDDRRPLSSLLVDIAGFVTIHAGRGSQNYSTLNTMAPPTVYSSSDGDTTYMVYRTTHHPLTMMAEKVLRDVGLPPSRRQLDEWDRAAEDFYALRPPEPGRADPRAAVEPESTQPDNGVPDDTEPAADADRGTPTTTPRPRVRREAVARVPAPAPSPQPAPALGRHRAPATVTVRPPAR